MLRSIGKHRIMCILRAGVAKLVYAPDSKSGVRQGHVGSSPTSGTKIHSTNFRPHSALESTQVVFDALILGHVALRVEELRGLLEVLA